MKNIIIIGGNELALNLINKISKKFIVSQIVRKKKNFCKKEYLVKDYNASEVIKILSIEKPDFVFNFVSCRRDNLKWCLYYNVFLSLCLIQWLKKNKNTKLVLFGTSAEYGDSEKKVVSEKDLVNPQSFYGLTKYIQSFLVENFILFYNYNILVLRIFNLKGKIYNPTTLVGKINLFIKKNHLIKKNKKINLGNLGSYRDFISLNQTSKIILKLMEKPYKGIFNIGSGKAVLVRTLVKNMFKKYKNLHFAEKKKKFHISERDYIVADIKKIKKLLNEKN